MAEKKHDSLKPALPEVAELVSEGDGQSQPFLGLDRKKRLQLYGWAALFMVVGAVVWALLYIRPDRWYTYTDQVAFKQVAKDVKLGFVLWDPSDRVQSVVDAGNMIGEPAVSPDGVRMAYTTGTAEGDANLFIRRWDGTRWGPPRPMRALNSAFHETSPAFNGDGSLLFFATDRPGGLGGYDIWVAKWDGAEYAWPLPLTARVNTPFDETGPALSPDGLVLYLASNRPRPAVVRTGSAGKKPAAAPAPETKAASATGPSVPAPGSLSAEQVAKLKGDFDIYAADIASETPYDLIVERQLSMLYSLREGALADPEVMAKLGGSTATEAAVDKALAFLAKTQEPDGRWDIAKHGGQGGHDVAATAFSLLAFYGRGERHDQPCKYQDAVARGIKWLTDQQDGATGDLRGKKHQGNAMYDHGIAALALVEAYGVTKDTALRPKAVAAIEFISDSQHEEGGWRYQPGQKGDLSVTGWMVMAIASAEMSGIRVPQKTLDGTAAFLKYVSGGKHGGSYGYTDPPGNKNSGRDAMNAVGFFCAQLMGSSANSTKAFEAAAILDTAGFKLADLYYVYYGSLATYQHQGPVWRNWREKMQSEFLKAQTADGSWVIKGGHSSAMGSVIGTALVTLCLEAHYRYTPLYGLGFEPDPQGPSPDVLEQHLLAQTPMFRHAKHVALLSSPADDTSPVVTDHGDFLYFASAREGGLGGVDLYRCRIGPKGLAAPRNLGPEINTAADETAPAVRMAGFHVMFNSNRDPQRPGLYGSKSRRVVRRYDYSKMPSGAWFYNHLGLLIGLVVSLIFLGWITRRALAQARSPRADTRTKVRGHGATPSRAAT